MYAKHDFMHCTLKSGEQNPRIKTVKAIVKNHAYHDLNH